MNQKASEAPTQKFSRAILKTIAPTGPQTVKSGGVSSAKPKGLSYRSIHSLIHHKDDDDNVKLPPPTAGEVHNLIHGHPEESKTTMGKNLRESLQAFRSLSECRFDAPVPGFNRHLRDMSPVTREIVLKARMPEIFAFAEDRRVDAGLVAGIAETTMRLGRIPDLGMYGLSGDVAMAVKDFLADTVLNVAEDEDLQKLLIQAEVEGGLQEGDERSKHIKLAADYEKLAEFHRRRAKEETDKSKMAKDNDRAHSEINARAAAERHTMLAKHCAGLADYHQLKASESAGTAAKPPAYPTADPKKTPPEPPQNPEKEKAPPTSEPKDRTESCDSCKCMKGPKKDACMSCKAKMEQTQSSNIGGLINNVMGKSAFPTRMNSVLPMIARSTPKADYNKWGNDKDSKKLESRLRKAETMEDLLEAVKIKKNKKHRKAKVNPEKQKGVLANVKTAPLFQDLGHKMDHACAKVNGHKYNPNYSKDLYNTCLKQGGGAAADKVVQAALKELWIREQGFVDEASNLRKKWETAMSHDALHKAAPNEPEPVVFAIRNILKMSEK